jgi:cell division protease FtsH
MRQKRISFSTSYLLIALAAILLFQYWLSPKVVNVSYTQFKNLVKEKQINSVVISTNQLKGFETTQDEKKEPLFPEKIYRTPRVDDRNLVEFLEGNNVDIIAENENTFLKTLLSWVVPALIFVGIWMFAIRKMSQAGPGMMTLGKHKAKIVAQTDLGVDFSSVAGQDEAKQELEEVIEFLKKPEKFTRLGAKIPKGILLVGPLEREKRSLPKQLPANPACLSFPSAALILLKCLWDWARPVFGTFLTRPARPLPALYLSMSLMLSARPAASAGSAAATTNGSRP